MRVGRDFKKKSLVSNFLSKFVLSITVFLIYNPNSRSTYALFAALTPDPVAKLLNSWGLQSLDDLYNGIDETKVHLNVARDGGFSQLIVEEEEKLADFLGLQQEIEVILKKRTFNLREGGVESAHSIDEIHPKPVELERQPPPPKTISLQTVVPPSPPIFEVCHKIQETRVSTRSAMEREELDSLWSATLERVPECAERSLILLHTHFKSDRLRLESDCSQGQCRPPLQSRAQLKELFTLLQSQLALEQLDSLVKNDIANFEVSFTKFLAEEEFMLSDISDLVEDMEGALLRALLLISPLDVSLLLDSVLASSNAAQSIKGKDIILLVGSTGVGKSTLMHFLAGSKMRMTNVDGIPHVEPEEVKSGLENVKFSCYSRSETTGIHAVTMDLNGKICIVCDTAGLGDTRGSEHDIASGIAMTSAIRSANSVKLVLIITQGAISDRFSNLRKSLIPSINRLIPSFKNYVDSVFYLFNMVSEQIDGITARLKDISTHLAPAEKADVDFTAMISDLARKTRSKTHCAISDLINGDYLELLSGFDNVSPILNPEKVFYDFAAPSSINTLKNQLRLHKQAISRGLDRFAVSGYRGDLLLLKFKLSQLLNLNLAISLPECKLCYAESVQVTFRFVQTMHCQTYHRIEICLKDTHTCNIDVELAEIMRVVRHLFELEGISSQHVGQLGEDGEESGGSNVQEIIAALFLRMQKDSKGVVERYLTTDAATSSPSSAATISAGSSVARSQLNKMRSLSHVLNGGKL